MDAYTLEVFVNRFGQIGLIKIRKFYTYKADSCNMCSLFGGLLLFIRMNLIQIVDATLKSYWSLIVYENQQLELLCWSSTDKNFTHKIHWRRDTLENVLLR